jgi:hypothetical protein
MPVAEFEPAIPASELPQTYALDHAATGIGLVTLYGYQIQREMVNIMQNMLYVAA